jgi:activator of HSP90 ATPase
MVEFTLISYFHVLPRDLYSAWLDSDLHSAMTGGKAHVNGQVGEEFDAWDGYIHGKNLELVTDRRIVQAWRTAEFSPDEADSRLEIQLEADKGGTKLTLFHSSLPPHGTIYEQGWEEAYFEPMREFFKDRKR